MTIPPPSGDDTGPQTIYQGIITAGAWVSLNVVLSLANKWLFADQDFHFPVFIILSGMTATTIGSGFILYVFKSDQIPSKLIISDNWKLLLLSAVTHGIATALENIAIDHTSISLNQVIKATTPAFTMVLSHYIEGRRYSNRMKATMIILIFGAALTTYHNPSYTFVGIATSITSCWLNVVRLMIIGRLLQTIRISPLALTFITSFPGVITLIPIFYLMEYSEFSRLASAHTRDILLVFFLAWAAFAYILVGLNLIRYTGPHYAAVIANLKVVLLVVLSSFLFKNNLKIVNMVGLLLAFASFLCYNFFKRTDEYSIKPSTSQPADDPGEIEMSGIDCEKVESTVVGFPVISSTDFELKHVNKMSENLEELKHRIVHSTKFRAEF